MASCSSAIGLRIPTGPRVGIEPVGEIEEFAAGTTCTDVFSLTPGDYTLLCNVVEEEENGRHESHLKQGMVTTLAVT